VTLRSRALRINRQIADGTTSHLARFIILLPPSPALKLLNRHFHRRVDVDHAPHPQTAHNLRRTSATSSFPDATLSRDTWAALAAVCSLHSACSAKSSSSSLSPRTSRCLLK
jgi:hypothetical protein